MSSNQAWKHEFKNSTTRGAAALISPPSGGYSLIVVVNLLNGPIDRKLMLLPDRQSLTSFIKSLANIYYLRSFESPVLKVIIIFLFLKKKGSFLSSRGGMLIIYVQLFLHTANPVSRRELERRRSEFPFAWANSRFPVEAAKVKILRCFGTPGQIFFVRSNFGYLPSLKRSAVVTQVFRGRP